MGENMCTEFYNEFPGATSGFINEPRYFVYDLSLELIAKAKTEHGENWIEADNTIKAIILLLYCWNFAAPITKTMTFEKIRTLLLKQKSNIKSTLKHSIIDNWEIDEEKILSIVSEFKNDFGQTGTSKALSLLNPKLFVMWDTRIRRCLERDKIISEIGNGETPEKYIKYLKDIKRNILGLKLQDRVDIAFLAKKIDEYHFVKILMK